MKILFIFPRDAEYGPVSVREFPSGGTEKCVIFLGEAFQKLGHSVEWLTTLEQVHAGPQDFPDVVISQCAELLEMYPEARKVWWTHHFSDQPIIQRNAAYGRCFADVIVTLSRCHADDFRTKLKLDSVTIPHGVWLSELATGERDPFRLIYASTPFRGLEKIPALFREIKAREPRASIAICSSMGTYGEGHKDAEYQKLFDELAEIPGVELKGALNQAQLYAEYSRASIFFYPCIWPETYCLAMDEAIAHGCLPVVPRHIGALTERVSEIGVLYQPRDEKFPRYSAVEHALFLMKPDREKYRGQYPQDWLDIARQWEREVLNG